MKLVRWCGGGSTLQAFPSSPAAAPGQTVGPGPRLSWTPRSWHARRPSGPSRSPSASCGTSCRTTRCAACRCLGTVPRPSTDPPHWRRAACTATRIPRDGGPCCVLQGSNLQPHLWCWGWGEAGVSFCLEMRRVSEVMVGGVPLLTTGESGTTSRTRPKTFLVFVFAKHFSFC